jgi:ribosomal protein S18 acetylase RimI-like enzyme
VNESAVRAGRAAAGRTWRLRPWPNAPDARLLILTDHAVVPTSDDFRQAIEEARHDGATVLRTSALFPRSAEIAAQVGFTTIDTLSLLRIRLDDEFDRQFESRHGAVLPTTRPLRPWQHGRAAEVDRDAFGMLWGNDAASLADIRQATPAHRARMIGPTSTRAAQRTIAGFAISGASADSGYVQRVAVHTDHRRRGYAAALVVDALAWMRRRQLGVAYVNTGVDNLAAQTLYRRLGFTAMDEVLTIAEMPIGG